jgi:hypothetical protein
MSGEVLEQQLAITLCTNGTQLVETILVRELKPADRYKCVGLWIHRGIMDGIHKATSGHPEQPEATETEATES